MKKFFAAFLLMTIFVFPARADKILVKFGKGKVPLEKLAKDSQIKYFKKLPLSGWVVVDPKGGILDFKKKYSFEAWEPNYSYNLTEVIPNDTSFSSQYYLKNTGQSGGLVGADVKATDAWETTTGNSSLIVAVIDTGVDWDHEDLQGNIWINANDLSGNGDEDGNGLVDDYVGWDFINDDNDPDDDHSHGSHVAGIIGAVGNNGLGIAGVNWEVRIMALKSFDSEGTGTLEELLPAIVYATEKGANVINASWGDGVYSLSMKEAIENFNSAGGIFVASAGNESGAWFIQDNDDYPFYPASFDLDGIISVGASDRYDTIAAFSCIGYNSVDLFAPGVTIYSLYNNNSYGNKSGTSMSAPIVSGAAALLWSASPGLSIQQVKDRILGNVEKLSILDGKCLTEGRLDTSENFCCGWRIPGKYCGIWLLRGLVIIL